MNRGAPFTAAFRCLECCGPADPNGSQKFSTISAEGADIFAKNIYVYAGNAFRLRPIDLEM